MLAGEGEPYSSFLCVGSVLWRARCKEGLGVEKISRKKKDSPQKEFRKDFLGSSRRFWVLGIEGVCVSGMPYDYEFFQRRFLPGGDMGRVSLDRA